MAQKIIRLNENDIRNIVKRTIMEMYEGGGYGFDDADDDDDDYLDMLSKFDDEVPEDFDSYEDVEEFSDGDGDFEEIEDDGVYDNDGEGDDEPDETDDDEESLEGPVTALSDKGPDEGDRYNDGDVLYYENVPIEKKDGRFHMTIEDGYDMGNVACPQITVVSKSLDKVKNEYNHLWNRWNYKDHGKYAESMVDRGYGVREFDDQTPLDDGTKLESFPVVIDLDRK